jgi:hypothetical protein
MSVYRIVAAILLVITIMSCEGPTGPAGPPGTGLESLSDPSVMPKVIYSYPGANTTGPYPELYSYDCMYEWCSYYSQFQVRFNKFMDVTSVRRAVRLTSPDGLIRADTSFILSVGGDVFILNPVDSNGYRNNIRFKVGSEYSIGVDSTAKDINGNALAQPFRATFVPEPVFRVMRVSPPDGEVNVSTNVYITLTFNSKVTGSILSHLSIAPELTGSWSIGYDSTMASFTPALTLPIETEFTVGVDASAEDAFGNRIPAPFSSRFTTTPFRVVYTYPAAGAADVPLTMAPSFNFSVSFDTSTIRAAFHIAPATAGTLSGLYPGTYNFTFIPDNGLLGSTVYTITIDSTLKEMGGSLLRGGYVLSFTTAPFSVTSTSPSDGATGVTRYNLVQVNVNGPINSATVGGSIQISPPAPYAFYSYDGSTWFQLNATSSSGWAANTTYTVTIGTGLRTMRGQALPAPYLFSFKTGPN